MATGAAAAWVVKALASAVAGLEEAIGTPESLDLLFREFGRSLPDSGATFTTLTMTFTTLSNHLGALAAAADNLDPTTDTAAALAEQLAAVGTALTAVVTDIDQLTQNPPTASLPAPLNDPEFWRTFGERLLGNLAYGYMSTHAPGVLAVLRATGVATAAVLDDQGASVVAPAALNWDDIPTLLTNPAALIRQTYQWPASFDHASLVAAVRQLVRSLGIEATMLLPDDAMLGMFWDQPMDATQASAPVPFSPIVFPLMSWSGSGADLLQSALVAGVIPVPDESRTGAPVGFALFLAADAGMSLTIPVTASFTLALGGGVDAGIYAAIRPTGTELLTGAGSAAATLTTALTGKPPAPWTVGDPGGIRLETSELSVTVTLAAAAGTGPSATAASATIEIDGSFAAYFDLSGADSFIASIIGGGTHSVHLNAGAVWSTRTGLRLKGGIAASSTSDGAPSTLLSTSIPVNVDLAGIIQITTVTIEAAPVTGGGEVRALLTGSLTLGAIEITVDRLGAALRLTDTADSNNLGRLNLGLGMAGPGGLGVSVAAPLVTGGGYLAVDEANGRYAGAVALKVGTVTIEGVGVLTTRLPRGGWSLIALADVDGLAVQLGFGIQLTGVGVLVGIHRSMNVTGLQALTRAGQLQNVLFPADLAANAPRVIADLDSLFPPAHGQYVVGPVVELTWGPGALLKAELAIYIELPKPLRIAVLGVLRLTAPNAAAPIADMTLDLVGVIDLTAKTLSLDMSLTHSTLANMPLTGQAALRAGWGANPVFLLAIGGFNPHFPTPAGFPALDRIGLSLGSGNLTLRLTAYLAVTTNTLQLGSRVDLRAAAGPASLTATVSFDALIQFEPFRLELDLAIHAAIVLWGSKLMALDITAHLTGPGPWQMQGQVHFSMLFLSFTVSVSGTFGAAIAAGEPAPADILTPLSAAVTDTANWTMSVPAAAAGLVLRAGVAGTALHPLGGLELHQRIVPLEQRVDRYGPEPLPAAAQFSITTGARSSASNPVTDLFAPAQYITMSDTRKLTTPSFQSLTSGLQIMSPATVVATQDATSDTRPDEPAVQTLSVPEWNRQVIDASTAAGATVSPGETQAALTAPAMRPLTGAMPTPSAAVPAIAPVGAQRTSYLSPVYGIAAQAPRYDIMGVADQKPVFSPAPDGSYSAEIAATVNLTPGQVVVYPSEIADARLLVPAGAHNA